MIKFKISRRLHKLDKEIIETIEINPQLKILLDEKRSISIFVKNLVNLFSMAHRYKIIDISDHDFFKINRLRYKSTKIIPDHFREITIDYTPWLGKKKCSKCLNYRTINDINYCKLKGKVIFGDYWKQCMFFVEKSQINNIIIK